MSQRLRPVSVRSRQIVRGVSSVGAAGLLVQDQARQSDRPRAGGEPDVRRLHRLSCHRNARAASPGGGQAQPSGRAVRVVPRAAARARDAGGREPAGDERRRQAPANRGLRALPLREEPALPGLRVPRDADAGAPDRQEVTPAWSDLRLSSFGIQHSAVARPTTRMRCARLWVCRRRGGRQPASRILPPESCLLNPDS